MITIFYFSGGESSFSIPAQITFGKVYAYDDVGEILIGDDGNPITGDVPYRTIVMLITLISHVCISSLTHYLFVEEKIPLQYDFFGCYQFR